jgi:hypothetical protein
MSNQPEERFDELFIAWDENGMWMVSRSAEKALDDLANLSDGRMFRVKRYEISFFLPTVEEGGELEPALGD